MTHEKIAEPTDEEEEIFKTLGHKIRRDIIKIIGAEENVSFSKIKRALGEIDSPALAYHLKFLHPLIAQKEGKYLLNPIGLAAFKLLSKTDQSVKLSKYLKMFTYAHIISITCWAAASVLIPLTVSYAQSHAVTIVLVNVILGVSSAIVNVLVGLLRKRY
jgi:DNA-binding transcriptional ArsR family regulator